MLQMLTGIWRFRFFIYSSISTEFRLRFVRNRLGGLWIVLNPLFQVLIFVYVLSSVMVAKLPGINNQFAYAIYLMAGTLFWSLFSELLNRCISIFVDNGNLLKKISFPKMALPLIAVGSVLVNNILLFLCMFLIFIFLGNIPGVEILALPILMILTVLLALSFGLILGVINVFIRDVGQLVPILLQLVYWTTPIVYVPTMIPEKYRFIVNLNPLTNLTMAYQDILLYKRFPNFNSLFFLMSMSFFLLLLSLFIVRKANSEMVDQL